MSNFNLKSIWKQTGGTGGSTNLEQRVQNIETNYVSKNANQLQQINGLVDFKNNIVCKRNGYVDYVDTKEFDIVSILDGEVISVEDSEVYGKVVTIKHNDNLKSVYSNVTGVLVNVGYKISQGEVFAMSSKSKLNTENESMLHFEVYYKESAIDPENMYTMTVSDFE